jgi:hypothetical protein
MVGEFGLVAAKGLKIVGMEICAISDVGDGTHRCGLRDSQVVHRSSVPSP